MYRGRCAALIGCLAAMALASGCRQGQWGGGEADGNSAPHMNDQDIQELPLPPRELREAPHWRAPPRRPHDIAQARQ